NLKNYKIKVAIVSPVLYGQFDDLTDVEVALDGVKSLGFDYVYETAIGADIYAKTAKEYINKDENWEKIISSSCPVVIRLIQIYYPDLIDCIIPLKTPEEITAQVVKDKICKETGASREDIGVFLLTTCPAHLMNVKSPIGGNKSEIDEIISFLEVFSQLKKYVSSMPEKTECKSLCTTNGMGWFNVRGQTHALAQDNHLVVDGIHSVKDALEQLENNKFKGLKFFEGVACKGGCCGGSLAFENTFVAKNRIDNFIARYVKEGKEVMDINDLADFDRWCFDKEVEECNVNKLDSNMAEALKKYKLIEEISSELPGLDCGSCGCPTCHALAEDIVKGYASEFDCIFIMRTKLNLANRESNDKEV
ncbi:MAG: ferredoxin, partial [Lachnospiraceae bacterium]|nr:ferredoxin [Lachnospiraceae bacterium]